MTSIVSFPQQSAGFLDLPARVFVDSKVQMFKQRLIRLRKHTEASLRPPVENTATAALGPRDVVQFVTELVVQGRHDTSVKGAPALSRMSNLSKQYFSATPFIPLNGLLIATVTQWNT